MTELLVKEKRILGTHYGLGSILLWAKRIINGIEGDKNPLLEEDKEALQSIINSINNIKSKYGTVKKISPKKSKKELTPEEVEAKQAKLAEKQVKAQERFVKAKERLTKAENQAIKIAARFSNPSVETSVEEVVNTSVNTSLIDDAIENSPILTADEF